MISLMNSIGFYQHSSTSHINACLLLIHTSGFHIPTSQHGGLDIRCGESEIIELTVAKCSANNIRSVTSVWQSWALRPPRPQIQMGRVARIIQQRHNLRPLSVHKQQPRKRESSQSLRSTYRARRMPRNHLKIHSLNWACDNPTVEFLRSTLPPQPADQ